MIQIVDITHVKKHGGRLKHIVRRPQPSENRNQQRGHRMLTLINVLKHAAVGGHSRVPLQQSSKLVGQLIFSGDSTRRSEIGYRHPSNQHTHNPDTVVACYVE